MPTVSLLVLARLLAALAVPTAGADPAGVSNQQNPVVTFSTPGTKSVTLTVCNAGGCSTVTRQLVVLEPLPAITALVVAPARLEVGSSVLLEAQGAGRPQLSYVWEILRGGLLVSVLSGASTIWNTAGWPPGVYTVLLQLSNAFGQTTASRDVLLLPKQGTSFFTVPACRLLDTRRSTPLRFPAPPRIVQVGGLCAVPQGARAVALNLTAVLPSAGGYVSVYPADYPHPLVSSLNFRAGTVRANFAVLPLSTDGNAQLAATASLAAAGTVDLVVDVEGYFLASSAAPVQPLTFQVRLCPFGFCSFAAGTPLFFTQAFSGVPSLYSYDWIGDGSFGPFSPMPTTSHTYPSPGVYTPAVRIVAPDGSVATLRHPAPIAVNPAYPVLLAPSPSGLSATFAGFVSFSSVDPTLSGSLFAYDLAAAPPPPNLLGYNVYVSRNGGPLRFAGAFSPALPASEPLVVPAVGPSETLALAVAAVNFAGEGPLSPPLALVHP